MSGIGLLNRIYGKGANGVDTKLICCGSALWQAITHNLFSPFSEFVQGEFQKIILKNAKCNFFNCLSFLRKQESTVSLSKRRDSDFRRNGRERCTPRSEADFTLFLDKSQNILHSFG
jgi:hypothetical protein